MMTALARNKYICEIADQIVFVGVNEKSSLKTFIEQFIGKSIMLWIIIKVGKKSGNKDVKRRNLQDYWNPTANNLKI